MKFMLDTNICIYVLNERPPALRQRFNKYLGSMCISAITLAELHYGAANSQKPRQNLVEIESFCSHLSVMSFDERAAEQYGLIRAALKRSGKLIGSNDLLIAAHAKAMGLILVSNNESEFKRVSGLKIVNWVA